MADSIPALQANLVDHLKADPEFMAELNTMTPGEFRQFAGTFCTESKTGDKLEDSLNATVLEALEELFHGRGDARQ